MHIGSGSVSRNLIASLIFVMVLGSAVFYVHAVRQRQAERTQASTEVETVRTQVGTVSATLGAAVPSSPVTAYFSDPFPVTLAGKTITYTLHLKNTGHQTVSLDQSQINFVHTSDSRGNQLEVSIGAAATPKDISAQEQLDSIPASLAPGQEWTGPAVIVSAQEMALAGGYSGWLKLFTSEPYAAVVSLPFGAVVRTEPLPKAWWEY